MTIEYQHKDIIDFAKDHFRKLEKGGRDKRYKGSRRVNNVDLRVWNGR